MNRASAVLSSLLLCACGDGEPDPYDLDFDIPRTEDFAPVLSDYALYAEPAAALDPGPGVLPYDLASELFTDYARKQRLVRIPAGASITRVDGTLEYPEGTILAKTFYYPEDLRDPASPNRILETRLLVKTDGVWNAATYLWNDSQTEATLLLDGAVLETTWTGMDGQTTTIDYGVPHEGECFTCHQSADAAAFIGPSLANLNRPVVRDGAEVAQLDYLAAAGVLQGADWGSLPSAMNYKDASLSVEARVRGYLDINCAHCHNPEGWDEATDRELDFRLSTPLAQTGIERKAHELPELLEEGEMPFLGTTLPHAEGIELLTAYGATVDAPEW